MAVVVVVVATVVVVMLIVHLLFLRSVCEVSHELNTNKEQSGQKRCISLVSRSMCRVFAFNSNRRARLPFTVLLQQPPTHSPTPP